MISDTIYIKTYPEPSCNVKEILRYAGCKAENEAVHKLLQKAVAEANDCLTYKVCYRRFDIDIHENECDLGFTRVKSDSLAKNLKNCSEIIVFAATIGLGIDRLIKKYTAISPSKAVMLQAFGAERIEALCNTFCEEMKQYFSLKPRFSPGYGDLPIELQKEIFSVLDCPRKIGLTLNDSMLMSPTKSVTAIIGITDKEENNINNKCSLCENPDCGFRCK